MRRSPHYSLFCLCSTAGEHNQADVVREGKAHGSKLPPSAEAERTHSVQIHGMFQYIIRTSLSVSPLYLTADRGYIHIMYNFRIKIQKDHNTCR